MNNTTVCVNVRSGALIWGRAQTTKRKALGLLARRPPVHGRMVNSTAAGHKRLKNKGPLGRRAPYTGLPKQGPQQFWLTATSSWVCWLPLPPFSKTNNRPATRAHNGDVSGGPKATIRRADVTPSHQSGTQLAAARASKNIKSPEVVEHQPIIQHPPRVGGPQQRSG